MWLMLEASTHQHLVLDPSGEILKVDVADGGLICSSGVALEAMGDKNDDCYVVNAAVYIGYWVMRLQSHMYECRNSVDVIMKNHNLCSLVHW